jgi:TIR domain
MTKRKPVPRVFLSHSSKDLWISERMKEKLEEVGVEVWLDAYDLPGGENVIDRIKVGLKSATECVILWSPASRDSEWVRHEAGLADGYGMSIVFVLLHTTGIPEPLRDRKYFGINDFPGYVTHLASLARTK